MATTQHSETSGSSLWDPPEPSGDGPLVPPGGFSFSPHFYPTHEMVLFDQTGLSAGTTGGWFALQRDERAYRPLLVTITGTADVDVEVRVEPGDTPTLLKNFTASEALMVGAFPQFRVVVNSAVTADVRVSIDGRLVGVA